jgi:Mlc titration factor MtfA (ptsG expression regulator)
MFWRRRSKHPKGFPAEWRAVLDQRMVHIGLLDENERARLEDITLALIIDKHWEPSRGFDLTGDIMVTVAAQAALLVLNLDYAMYNTVSSILVHPTTQTLNGQRGTHVSGVVSDGPFPVLGSASFNGPVVIAWDAALRAARHPERGHNVVYHEFAHKLDMTNGIINGTPRLTDDEEMQRWVAVCSAEFHALRAGTGGSLLRDYGGVNPGEFFAVATEIFFDHPVQMQGEKPDLFGVLRDFYQQDPAARERRAVSQTN